ncbi:hypothetical protein [Sphingomonas sp. 35-24ZXX]|uniref:hypothetical protein n=1 Tax=Sphingomonas sp. 35-24ZXX TaxID=1545915 RepID=UPI000A4760F6|nr:hypothetical protein [Sphingomonas sp. 35-24ZXX]
MNDRHRARCPDGAGLLRVVEAAREVTARTFQKYGIPIQYRIHGHFLQANVIGLPIEGKLRHGRTNTITDRVIYCELCSYDGYGRDGIDHGLGSRKAIFT